MTHRETFRIERRDDAAILWIDVPGKDVNTLHTDFAPALHSALDALEADGTLTSVVIASAKEDSFVVGADIEMLGEVRTSEAGSGLARTGQQVMDRLASFRLPMVAAIHGPCLGGGMEMALACCGRVASTAAVTRLGQPEVRLGVIPGAGGTQRLPRLIGLEAALDLILSGRQVPAEEAVSLGLVDEAVHPAILLEVALQRARQLVERHKEGEEGIVGQLRHMLSNALHADHWRSLLLEDNPAGRKLLFQQAKQRILAKTHGNLPAPLVALEVIRQGVEEDMEAGLAAEAERFGELAVSAEARSLMALFVARQVLKKESGLDRGLTTEDAEPRSVRTVGVLGAGLMGSGIAEVTAAEAGLAVRLKDQDHEPLRLGLHTIARSLDRRVEKRKMSASERENVLARIQPTVDYSGFERADVVIEAVLEDLEVKQKVLREVEEHGPAEVIFASNTSALPIAEIAAASRHPERVIGMHYFSPVPRIPLLEVVVSAQTAPWVTATCVELGKRQGKTVIVVNDGAGFYTSRILAPYVNEAVHLLIEGVPIDVIDRALVEGGFPMGPFELLDEVGIDVVGKVAAFLHHAFGVRMAPAPGLHTLAQDERLGKKNGRGFYRYEEKEDGYHRRNGEVDKSIYELLDVEVRQDSDVNAEEVARRPFLQMVNEAARCYGDGILRSARDGDVGAVFGLGFPPFLGGPLCYVDRQGPSRILAHLNEEYEHFGARYTPAPVLAELARRDAGFHHPAAPAPGAHRTGGDHPPSPIRARS